MTPLDVAGLVVIAGQALGEDSQAVLGRLDVAAAEAALAEAAPDGASDPAASAAAPLSALIPHRPLGRGNEVVAVATMTTFLALNGWQANLDPGGAFPALLTGLAGGQLPADDLIAWLSDHVFPSSGAPAGAGPTKEEGMTGRRPRRQPGGLKPGA